MPAIQLSTLNSAAYSQDFNTLNSSGTTPWVNDQTVGGWYATRTSGTNNIIAGSGTGGSGSLYSFGAAGSSDRALGSIGSSTPKDLFWGVRFVNNTSQTINYLAVSYVGEQWRKSGAAAQTVDFQYQIGATNLTSGTWADANDLDFTSIVNGGTSGALNGNATANSKTIFGLLTNLQLAPGQEIWFRWKDIDHPGIDHGLAIDDFSLSLGTLGTTGDDNLQGTNQQNYIDGLTGNDIITGLQGDDFLIGGGGQDKFIINTGDGTDTINDLGGAGSQLNPSSSVRAEMDILKFQGAGLTARNMLLTQNGNNLEITFENVANTKIILQNFQLENLNNFREAKLSQPKIGNILFDGDGDTIQDSFDIYASTRTSTTNYKQDFVTFLNDLDNNYIGINSSNDVINGQGGNDTISGLSGNDVLRGGAGNDILIGGKGNDILVGGIGNDRFVLEKLGGTDTISDFTDGQDLIALSGGLTFGQLTITQGTGGNVNDTLISITSTNETLARLIGVSVNIINANDFTSY